MSQVLHRLDADWDFIEKFLSNPSKALEGYDLRVDEREALMADDPMALAALGMDDKSVCVALSGAHSQTCPD